MSDLDRSNVSTAIEAYAAIEADTTTNGKPYERAEALRRIAQLYGAEGDEETARIVGTRAALFDFSALPRGKRRNGADARFFPKLEYDDGSAYPTISAFNDDAVAAIETWLASTTNPIHRARCADFLWEKRRDHRAAQVAADAYLDAADLYIENGWYGALADALDRSAELALKLRDQARIDGVKATAFRIADELVHNSDHPVLVYTRDIIETLQGFGRGLADDEWAKIVDLTEKCIAACDHDGTGKRSCLQLLWSAEARRRQPDAAIAAKRRFAQSLEAEAREAMTTKGALVGFSIYREALSAYIEVGDTAKIDELKRLVGEAADAAGSDMKRISTTVPIPREEFERFTNVLLQRDLQECLEQLAALERHIPSVESVRHEAAELRRKFPLQWLATRVTLDGSRVVDAPSSEEESARASFAQTYLLDRGLRMLELGYVFDRLESEKELDAAAPVEMLRRGGLIDDDTLAVVAVGFERYFAKDDISALHILVPQLEDFIRDGFLPRLGVATTAVQHGLTREKPLDQVLETPKLRELLGENLATFLELLLTNQRGDNLRNKIAHGLMKAADCTRQRVQLVIYCFITLAKFGVVEHSAEGDEPSAQAGT